MFYYLGRKKRLAGKYPAPVHDTIVEPFGGSAAYSLHGDHWEKRVIVNELNPDVIGVWRFLQQASEADIAALPEPEAGDKLSDITSLSESERWLIAYHINPGANQRSNIVTKFSRWGAGKRYIQANLHKIEHWEIVEGEFRDVPFDGEVTWFIDPPYQATGQYYMCNTVDNYEDLRSWVDRRTGQIIVCERLGATWLPFETLGGPQDICGKNKTQEVVYVAHQR